MPVGIQRLNATRPQPSSRIIFIKPLPGPTAAYALDFLERIAAICHPIMTHSHLSIMTLEEHEPNLEFIGRNFNAGEIIQLVLKAPSTGRGWLSFRSVQMVMMHELAHCVQMNHGREFWKVRNRFAAELRELWDKGYTGDGLWGRGQTLLSGQYHTGGRSEDDVLPAHVCGGTFRSWRGGKRKRKRKGGVAGTEEEEEGKKKKETYAERQQRRIKKKFGENGIALGGDEETKVKLENGKKTKGKPRVAGSARGSQLRAAAALSRLQQTREEEEEKEENEIEKQEVSGSESESEYEDTEVKGEAFNLDGSRMRDGKGRGLIKVCEDEDQDDVHVKQEIEELQGLDDAGIVTSTTAGDQSNVDRSQPLDAERGAMPSLNQGSKLSDRYSPSRIRMEDIPQYVEKDVPSNSAKSTKAVQINVRPLPSKKSPSQTPNHHHHPPPPSSPTTSTTPKPLELLCPICSMSNGPNSLLCIACSHVLDTDKITRHWRCGSDTCRGSQYVNAADCGRCGICGARRD